LYEDIKVFYESMNIVTLASVIPSLLRFDIVFDMKSKLFVKVLTILSSLVITLHETKFRMLRRFDLNRVCVMSCKV
jgi:hypothetical protein